MFSYYRSQSSMSEGERALISDLKDTDSNPGSAHLIFNGSGLSFLSYKVGMPFLQSFYRD